MYDFLQLKHFHVHYMEKKWFLQSVLSDEQKEKKFRRRPGFDEDLPGWKDPLFFAGPVLKKPVPSLKDGAGFWLE